MRCKYNPRTPLRGATFGYFRLWHERVISTHAPLARCDVSRSDALREPDKKYRIHDDDKEKIKKYKK